MTGGRAPAAASRAVTAHLRGITVRMGGLIVVDDATIVALPGERTALVGPNGGGKTTLVRVLLGLLPAESGRIVFTGPDGTELPRPRIGYLSQRSTLEPEAPVTPVDLVSLSLVPRGGFRGLGEAVREARRALVRAGLSGELHDRPVGRLSGGQRQRVLLARALAGSPPILVLDEPDTALDAEGLMTLRRLVAEETARGTTVLFVTHDSDAMGGADAIWRVDRRAVREPVS